MKNMTPKEAHDLALEKVQELKDEGIEVIITPSESKNNPDTVEKYKDNPNGVPSDIWVRAQFVNLDQFQAEKVFEAAGYLGLVGMKFDTGGTLGLRDWELDWSFFYTGEEDMSWREGREEIETILKSMEAGTFDPSMLK